MLHSKIVLFAALVSNTDAISRPGTNSVPRVAAGNNATLLNDSSEPVCDSVPYGFKLRKRSCEEAVTRLPHDLEWLDESVPYVNRNNERDVGGQRYVLPWRELSCTFTYSKF